VQEAVDAAATLALLLAAMQETMWVEAMGALLVAEAVPVRRDLVGCPEAPILSWLVQCLSRGGVAIFA
jgi:hypothetical protein